MDMDKRGYAQRGEASWRPESTSQPDMRATGEALKRAPRFPAYLWCSGVGLWLAGFAPFAPGWFDPLALTGASVQAKVEALGAISVFAQLFGMVLGTLAIAVFARSVSPLRGHLRLLTGFSIAVALLLLSQCLLPSATVIRAIVVCAGGVLRGFLSGMMLIAWVELLGTIRARELVLAIALALVVYTTLGLAGIAAGTSALGPDACWIVAAFSVVGCAACLSGAWHALPNASLPPAEYSSPPKRTVVVMLATDVLYGVLFGVMRTLCEAIANAFTIFVGFALGTLSLLLLLWVTRKRKDTSPLMRAALVPPTLCCIAALFLSGSFPSVACGLLCVAMAMQAFFVQSVFCDMTLHFPWLPPVTGGVGGACLALGIAMGSAITLLPQGLAPFLVGESLNLGAFAAVILASTLLIAIVYLPDSHREASPWRLSSLLVAQPDSDERLAGACDLVASRHGLTAREREVLALLARGRNQEYVQRTLIISANTAKTHIYHVLKKTGAHSRQELMDMVEREL